MAVHLEVRNLQYLQLEKHGPEPSAGYLITMVFEPLLQSFEVLMPFVEDPSLDLLKDMYLTKYVVVVCSGWMWLGMVCFERVGLKLQALGKQIVLTLMSPSGPR